MSKYQRKKAASPLQSQAWLTKRYRVDKKSAQEIADELNTSVVQVYRYLDKYGLRN